LAADGPKDWPRIANADQVEDQVPIKEPVKVNYIGTSDDRISFDVDRVGLPVLVKASYFPNWQAKGAKGPYRVSPNLMVVIPTSKHVDLHYGRAAPDWLGIGLTLVGLAGVVWLFRRDRARGKWIDPIVPEPLPPAALGVPYEMNAPAPTNGQGGPQWGEPMESPSPEEAPGSVPGSPEAPA
jgi:hypothetical protein